MRHDLQYGWRLLLRNPGLSALAVLALALGIGANTAIFSVVNAVLLRDLPYREPDRLTMLWLDNSRLGLKEDLTSYPNFADWKSQNTVFEAMAGFTPSRVTLAGGDEPERVSSAMVAAEMFALLGVRPTIGRSFTAEEEQPGKDAVVILSHGLWVRRFGSDANIAGKTVRTDGRTLTIIGVMPPEFRFPTKLTELWEPLAVSPQAKASRGGFWLSVVGRLKPGIPLEQARAEMSGIAGRIQKQYPDQAGYGCYVVPMHAQIVGRLRTALLVLFGAVVFVLLIACANVANLLLARGAGREREIAVRTALGAGRGRLIRQLLTESVVLSWVAAVAGLVLAYGGVRALVAFGPRDMPRLDEVGIDWRVLLFTLGLSLVTGFIFGLAPALASSRHDLSESLKQGSRGSRGGLGRALAPLVVAEVALSLVLLAGAGLLIRSFASLRAVDPGFRPERVLTLTMVASRSSFPEGPQVAAFYQQLLERLRALPGVQAAGAITDIFLSETPNSGSFTVEGHPPIPPEQQIEATRDVITPDYFRAMGVPLVRGRWFTDQDGPDAPPVVIINETMARTFWPNEDPVGKRFKFGGPQSRAPWMTIAGVAGDMRRQGLEKRARSETFLPYLMRPARGMTFVIRASGEPAAIAAAVRDTVRGLDRASPIVEMAALDDLIGESVAARRFQTLLLALFSGVALALAAIGIYGVFYHAVVERTQEIGIRMALGAGRSDVLRMVLGQGLPLVGAGVAIGIVATLALTRLMTSLLFEVSATDPVTLVVVALVLSGVGLLASYVPARRAARVDPMVALRYE